ncbi:MAG: cysteine--tRNA ligase [Candidatus Gastranaerophilales bacterium]|nr:cysteine--tRNA ligase [Candidatus Gastranaerophilales bacterium]
MLKIYNTLTNKIEEFKPIEENKVKMYVCGPTVYDHAHLGHARCYITWDTLYRYLKFKGYDVTYCRNVTDVDDKILKKSDTEGVEPSVITDRYYKSFINSMNGLNVLKPDVEPRATKTLGEMIAMVKKLEQDGFAYAVDGDVYFRVEKYSKYGELSSQPIKDLLNGARVEANDKKESPLDFALWKKDEKFGYKSPWGVGRPGWHIECSAMSKKHLGNTIDIHAGGADLAFPHHENERAQSECANGCQFSKYWMHNGFVTINKEKMSKSLNNFLTIDDVLKTYDTNAIRLFILTNHYRMPVEFNDVALSGAAAGAKRLINSIAGIEISSEYDTEAIKEFENAMDEDLNTSKALAILFGLAEKVRKNENKQINANTLSYLGSVLGFDFSLSQKEVSENELKEIVEPLYNEFNIDNTIDFKNVIDEVIKIRKTARDNKDWAKSDEIRDKLLSYKIQLKDTKEGTTWQIL